MAVNIYDDRDPNDKRRRAADPSLSFLPPEQSLLVIQGSRMPWNTLQALLAVTAEHAGSQALVYFCPWAPGTEWKREAFIAAYPEGTILGWECMVSGRTSTTFPTSALDVRGRLGGAQSGLWLLGAGDDLDASERLRQPQLRGDPITAIAEQLSDVLPFCLSMDEGDLSTLFLRLTPDTFQDADTIKAAVAAAMRL